MDSALGLCGKFLSGGLVKLDRGSKAANDHASLHVLVGADSAAIRARDPFFGFYVGRSDSRFRDENVVLNEELDAAHIAHLFEVYAGGHTTTLWEHHAVAWLRLALHHLSPPAA